MNKKTNKNKDFPIHDYASRIDYDFWSDCQSVKEVGRSLSSYMDIPDEKIEKLFADMRIEIKLRNDDE